MTKIGVIGGSGLEKLDMFLDSKEIECNTPYGSPSSKLYSAKAGNNEVYVISRHGREHTIPPTQVNNLANIRAFKDVGCDYILASTACGSLREDIHPGDLVIPDQFIDFTRLRRVTFYDSFPGGNVMHTAMPDPFSHFLRKKMKDSCLDLTIPVLDSGTIITIEGPRFSTRAESRMYRIWGADLVNMSVAPEAALANEAGIPYACIAMSTDYDAWREDGEHASWDAVVQTFEKNSRLITQVLARVISLID
jgi:5'-methylthioadenosine phosphorylase